MFDIESKNRDINSWSVVCIWAFAILAYKLFSTEKKVIHVSLVDKYESMYCIYLSIVEKIKNS